jgi:tripartite-type tricarboxylate transporter receptor subunit TctC
MQEFLAKRLIPPALSESPAEFNAYVQAESKRWTRIIRENKVKLD